MAEKKLANITVKNAKIMHRNFAGKEGPYNAKGDRNFSLILEDPDLVETLIADGWNIKATTPRDEGDEPLQFLPVKVKFDYKPPHVVLISSNGRNNLDEDTVGELDFVSIEKLDLIVTPYQWEFNGKQGVKAYLKTAFVTIEEDELEREYAEITQDEE